MPLFGSPSSFSPVISNMHRAQKTATLRRDIKVKADHLTQVAKEGKEHLEESQGIWLSLLLQISPSTCCILSKLFAWLVLFLQINIKL